MADMWKSIVQLTSVGLAQARRNKYFYQECCTYPVQQGEGGGVHLFWCDTWAEATGMVLPHAAASCLLDVRE